MRYTKLLQRWFAYYDTEIDRSSSRSLIILVETKQFEVIQSEKKKKRVCRLFFQTPTAFGFLRLARSGQLMPSR